MGWALDFSPAEQLIAWATARPAQGRDSTIMPTSETYKYLCSNQAFPTPRGPRTPGREESKPVFWVRRWQNLRECGSWISKLPEYGSLSQQTLLSKRKFKDEVKTSMPWPKAFIPSGDGSLNRYIATKLAPPTSSRRRVKYSIFWGASLTPRLV